MTHNEDIEDTALVPLSAGPDDAVVEALKAVYAAIPGPVVGGVEYHRIQATADYLGHMYEISKALAPFGAFKDWCAAAGVNYGSVSKALSRRFGALAPDVRDSHSRLASDAASDERLLSAGTPQMPPAHENTLSTPAKSPVPPAPALPATADQIELWERHQYERDLEALGHEWSDALSRIVTAQIILLSDAHQRALVLLHQNQYPRSELVGDIEHLRTAGGNQLRIADDLEHMLHHGVSPIVDATVE